MSRNTTAKAACAVTLWAALVFAHQTAIPPISSGFGANGGCRTLHDSVPHPGWEGHFVHCFRPASSGTASPVVLFCHGITATDPCVYAALIEHMVSKGFVVLYSPFRTPSAMMKPMVAYRVMWAGFEKGVSAWDGYIDKSRIGVVGHSHGGGAAAWVMRTAIVDKKWGTNGAFMFVMAPWYVNGLSQWQLKNFPKHVKMIVQVYEDDRVNDHRIGKDLYNTIGIPRGEKAFVVVRSDYSEENALVADHDVPVGSIAEAGSVNALDYYAVYRLLDALASYAFNANSFGKSIALGDDGEQQDDAGMWPCGRPVCPMCRYSNPRMVRTQQFCVNFWYHAMNPRTRVNKRLPRPLRLALHSPVTLWNYCLFVQQNAEK